MNTKLTDYTTKPYDPDAYKVKGLGTKHTIHVLMTEVERLNKLKTGGQMFSADGLQEIESKIIELTNNISFLREYR